MPLIHIDRNMIEKCWQFSTDSAGTQQAVEYGQKNSRPRDVAEIARDNMIGKLGEAAVQLFLQKHGIDIKLDFAIYPRGRWDDFDVDFKGWSFDIKTTKHFGKNFLIEWSKLQFRADAHQVPHYFLMTRLKDDFMDPEADDLPMGVDVELCGFIDSRLLVEENASVKTLEAGDFIPGTHTEMTAKSFCVPFDDLDVDWNGLVDRLLNDQPFNMDSYRAPGVKTVDVPFGPVPSNEAASDLPRYSLLLSGSEVASMSPVEAERLVCAGVCVMVFGKASTLPVWQSLEKYGRRHFSFHPVSGVSPCLRIVDGVMTEDQRRLLQDLAVKAPSFNIEQYFVEHAPIGPDTAIIVKASAGTGKTTVMIDRIMHLFAMVPDLMPSDVCMVTFTNKAAASMAAKIQEQLVDTAGLVKSRRWREVLENSGGLTVSTIDSFFHGILSSEGGAVGYGVNARLRSFRQEKLQIVRDVINEFFLESPADHNPDRSRLTIHEVVDVVMYVWDKLHSLGYFREEFKTLDFGSILKERNEESSDEWGAQIIGSFQKILVEAEGRYQELKHRENAYGVDDIKGEFDELSRAEELPLHRRSFRYLFVDEFQDTDNSQIAALDWLRRRFGCQLFVVGDVKQSIYRFRGAEESAFVELVGRLKSGQKKLRPDVKEYVLKKNYRTSPELIREFNKIFSRWGASSDKLLIWDADAEAGIKGRGTFEIRACGWKESKQMLVDALKGDGHTCVLTRTNSEAARVAALCRSNGLPCIAKLDGGFYQSAPVRHLHAVLGALLYPEDARRLFNALMTPYFGEVPDLQAVLSLQGNDVEISNVLTMQLAKFSWLEMQEESKKFSFFRFLETVLNRSRPVEQYAARRNAGFRPYVENEELIDVEMYRDNLNKLLGILYDKFTGDYPTLLSVYSFLNIKMQTDKGETLVYPEIQSIDGRSIIETMTVHKAKGLEFDSVIIPNTNMDFFYENPKVGRKDCIVDCGPDGSFRLGWRLGRYMNDQYEKQRDDESMAIRRDEARLLYVAMTRARRRLLIFVPECSKRDTWAELLDIGEGVA